MTDANAQKVYEVSTHSRPKAAAFTRKAIAPLMERFNTQPPEGGCQARKDQKEGVYGFNTQPPEGGCSLPKKARKISALNTVFR